MDISKKLFFLLSVLPIFCSVFAMEERFQAQILKRSEKIGITNGTTLLAALKGAALHSWSKKGKFQSNVNFPVYEISVLDEDAGTTKIHYVIDFRPEPKASDSQENEFLGIMHFQEEPDPKNKRLKEIKLKNQEDFLYDKEQILATKEKELVEKQKMLAQKENDLSVKEEFLKAKTSAVFDKVPAKTPINQNDNIKQRSLYYPYILGISGFLIGGVSAYYGHAKIDAFVANIASLFRKN